MYRNFWAKTNREKIEGLDEEWIHPLWAHLIDVANTALVLYEMYLPMSLKKKMAHALNMSVVDTGKFLSIWIGLHDIGKAIPGFQGLHPHSKEKLSEKFPFPAEPERLHHGHATISIMYNLLNAKGVKKHSLLEAMAAFVGIHHGILCTQKEWVANAQKSTTNSPLGNGLWKASQLQLVDEVLHSWGTPMPDFEKIPTLGLMERWPEWLMAFAGWATLADWLGSMQSYFPTDIKPDSNIKEYIIRSREGAKKAFESVRLNQRANLKALSFEKHFGFPPRPLQDVMINLELGSGPSLTIIEGPTGDGKTEGALYMAARRKAGLYIAMPSMSTSNSIFPRLKRFIAGDPSKYLVGAHDGDSAALRLVHGNDLLYDDAVALLAVNDTISDVNDDDSDKKQVQEAKNRALSWFMPRKKGLLVPYGVGTVDQSFLGVLYAKHFFLRLFSLSGKTVIFDEVHAYDAYMNAIFERLLSWLKALDVNVIILSATLPAETRNRILKTWSVSPPTLKSDAPYPVVWHAENGRLKELPFSPTSGREQKLTFRWCDSEPKAIAKLAEQLINKGACVFIVCNTVERAQKVFNYLDRDELLPVSDRHLLHARMPMSWRQLREDEALKHFGENRQGGPGLLVGTQIIEQSLDVDSDVMITDLAPVDLVLQRAGRNHRHKRKRPEGFDQPLLFIACKPAGKNLLPEIDDITGYGRVYDRTILWKTWEVLHKAKGWALPQGDQQYPGYRSLIESVYGDLKAAPTSVADSAKELFNQAYEDWKKRSDRLTSDAKKRIIPAPDKLKDIFTYKKPELLEEDEAGEDEVPLYLQAFTRNPEGPSISVLIVFPQEDGWSTEPNQEPVIHYQPDQKIDSEKLIKIFGASTRISKKKVIKHLLKHPHEKWTAITEKHTILKRFHLIEIKKGEAILSKTKITLDQRLGLVYKNFKL